MLATLAATAIPQDFKALPLPVSQLSLSAVLKCGQSFRWTSFPLHTPASPSAANEADTGMQLVEERTIQESLYEWRFCLQDRVVCLRQNGTFLFYRSEFPGRESRNSASEGDEDMDKEEEETLRFIRDYFRLDTDLLELYDTWSANDPVFRSLRARFRGIRILRQDPWECLISFICSSNNNISRISQMIRNLCKHFSPPLLSLPDPAPPPSHSTIKVDTLYQLTPPSTPHSPPSIHSPRTYHPFPPPSSLSSPSVSTKLRALGFGYRAEYIQRTASMLLEANGNSDEGVCKFLEGLRRIGTEKAREELMKCVGVGRKVADCVLLMSLDKREVIPVDTHVHKIAIKHYGLRGSSSSKTTMSPKLYDEVNARLAKIWGEYAGWAHSVLFTADLKSFSTYGLPTPSPTPSLSPTPRATAPLTPSSSSTKSRSKAKAKIRTASRVSRASRTTPHETPQTLLPTPNKRKRRGAFTENKTLVRISAEVTEEAEALSPKCDSSLADRVKRRRRTAVRVDEQCDVANE